MTARRRVPISPKTGEPILPEEAGIPVTRAEAARASLSRTAPEGAAATAECACPHLDPADWHEVESDWSDISFLKAHTKAVMGVPVGYAALQAELRERAGKLGGTVPEDAMLLLGPGRFRRPLLLEVDGLAPGAKGAERPGGIAFSRIVEAPWGEMQRVVNETEDAARERYGRKPDGVYVWYLTCRECSSARMYETLVLAHYRQAPG